MFKSALASVEKALGRHLWDPLHRSSSLYAAGVILRLRWITVIFDTDVEKHTGVVRPLNGAIFEVTISYINEWACVVYLCIGALR